MGTEESQTEQGWIKEKNKKQKHRQLSPAALASGRTCLAVKTPLPIPDLQWIKIPSSLRSPALRKIGKIRVVISCKLGSILSVFSYYFGRSVAISSLPLLCSVSPSSAPTAPSACAWHWGCHSQGRKSHSVDKGAAGWLQEPREAT